MHARSRLTADPIGTLLPWVEGDEKRHREGLLRARDLASSNLRAASSPHASALLWMIVETTRRGPTQALQVTTGRSSEAMSEARSVRQLRRTGAGPMTAVDDGHLDQAEVEASAVLGITDAGQSSSTRFMSSSAASSPIRAPKLKSHTSSGSPTRIAWKHGHRHPGWHSSHRSPEAARRGRWR